MAHVRTRMLGFGFPGNASAPLTRGRPLGPGREQRCSAAFLVRTSSRARVPAPAQRQGEQAPADDGRKVRLTLLGALHQCRALKVKQSDRNLLGPLLLLTLLLVFRTWSISASLESSRSCQTPLGPGDAG